MRELASFAEPATLDCRTKWKEQTTKRNTYNTIRFNNHISGIKRVSKENGTLDVG